MGRSCKVAYHCPRKGQKEAWYTKQRGERVERPRYRFTVLKAEGHAPPASLLFPFVIAAADGAAADGAAADGAAADGAAAE